MPVRKILRKPEIQTASYPELGRLHKGSPKGTSKRGGFQGGDDLNSAEIRLAVDDRFKSVPSSSGEYETLHSELADRYSLLMARGFLKIQFPFKTIEENLSWSNKLIKIVGTSPRTFVDCDGETQNKRTGTAPNPKQPGKTIPIIERGAWPCQVQDDGTCPCGAVPFGILKVFLPELHPGAIVLYSGLKIVDIQNLLSELEPYRGYDLRGIPFHLFRRPDTITVDDQPKINWGLHLEVDPQVAGRMLAARSAGFDRQLMNEINGPTTDVLPSSPTKALAASTQAPRLKGSDDWAIFQQAVAAAIRTSDRELLESAVEAAEDLIHQGFYDSVGMRDIAYEHDRAEGIIRENMPRPSQPIESAAPPTLPEWQKELMEIGASLDFTQDEIKKLAEAHGIRSIKKSDAPRVIELMKAA